MAILDLQRRQRELGRIRMGDKGGKGQPQKLSHFRLTSSARHLLDEAAGLWGGTVQTWTGAPTEGQYELYTATDVLPIVIPPGRDPVTQWYEQWTGGGCTHRCDGARNTIDDSPCSCDPDGRACKATTRVNVMLPDLRDVGVWRLETHGINAAYELPGTIEVIQMASQAGRFLTGRLRIEHRTSKKAGQTRRYIVPVIDLDVSMGALMSGATPPVDRAIEAPTPVEVPRAIEAPPVDVDAPERDAPEQEQPDNGLITESQRRRMFAVAKDHGVSITDVKLVLMDLTGQDSSKAVPRDRYDAVIAALSGELTTAVQAGDVA